MRKKPKFNKKSVYTVCIIATVIIFAVFTARLIDWQLVHGDEYRTLAQRSTSYTVQTAATRGEILDKNGVGLVVNTTHYKVVIDKLYINETTLDSTLLSLISTLDKAGEKWEDTLPVEIDRNGEYQYKESGGDDVQSLLSTDFLNLPENTSADDCMNALVKRYKIGDGHSKTDLRNLVSIHYNMEITGYSNSSPYIFAEDISQKSVSAISESTQGVSGVDVQTYLKRGAEDSDLAPHILGALGAMTDEEYKQLSEENSSYKLSDSVGKFGIEHAFEEQLKGEGGTKIIKRNSDGTIVDTVQTIDAKPGNTVYLTIDSELQRTAADSLEAQVKAAKADGKTESKAKGKEGYGEDCEAGAVVMLSVKDFSVLAAASYPTYDLNKYSEYGDYYVKLAQDETSPMYNRAFVGSFACGSVYKPCVASAALEEKVIDSDTLINCTGFYDYYPSNVVECMHIHGNLDVTGAITRSCNYFFAETGRRLGIDTMYLYAEKFGFGEYTGVEIEESKGTLAGRDSTSWLPGNTVQAAIGQSDNAFTPLQLATYVATIANNGTRLKTHVVSKITDYERKSIISEYGDPEVADTCGVSQKNLDIVKDAMLSVTQNKDGTANYMFGDYKVKVAAKTGTAENSGSDHTTFICYAPFDDPEVAVAVVIEHGAKGKYSMQVAKDLLDRYFAL